MIDFFEQNKFNLLSWVRITIGLLMIYHGIEVFDDKLIAEYAKWDQFKAISSPKYWITFGKAIELLAGISLAMGFWTRIGAILLIISMLYILIFIGNGQFWYADQHPFLLFLFGLLFLFWGGGQYSIDSFLKRKK